MLRFMADHGYKIELTPLRDKQTGGLAERMVHIVTAKTNNAMLENSAPPSFWCCAMFKTTQDLNFNYSKKIDTSPHKFIDMKYLHSFFAECYMYISLKDRTSKLPARRAQRCRFLAYLYTTIFAPTYVLIIDYGNDKYGGTRVSKDIIFDVSCVFDKYIDNSPTDAEFAALNLPIKDITPRVLAPNEPVSFMDAPPIDDLAHAEQAPHGTPNSPPLLELYKPGEYLDLIDDLPLQEKLPAPLIFANLSEFQERINEFGLVEFWNDVTGDLSNAPVMGINQMHFDMIMSLFLINITIETLALKSFVKAVVHPDWHPPIIKELDNFCENKCFEWIKDIGKRRLLMIRLFSYKSDMSKKARMVIDESKRIPGLDYNPDEEYCWNFAATSIKVFFALSALYGLTLRGGDLVGAYLVTPGSKDFMLRIATPQGIKAPPGIIPQVLGNLYGLPSSGCNFSTAVDAIVTSLGYKSTPFDPKFFCKWIEGRPILLMFHSDDFRGCGPSNMIAEWDTLVASFEAARYKVKDCTKEPFVGINVTSDNQGNYYLDQKKSIEGVVKAAKVSQRSRQ